MGRTEFAPRTFAIVLTFVAAIALTPVGAARASTCDALADQTAVAHALAEIERSIDPCGESAEIGRVLQEFRHCAARGVRICTDAHSERNFIERAADSGEAFRSTITWNPALRSELERGCDGDAGRAVLRDPTASLLHELVHAVQDCAGLDPSDHEFEAVRIENIYRRARQLCQRTRYGERPLPAAMRIACEPGHCRCNTLDRALVAAPAIPDATGMTYAVSAGDTNR